MDIIKVTNLSKSFLYYKKDEGLKSSLKNLFHREKLVREAVKSISFTIDKGEIVGFLGPNGAGKTTTLKMLSGILFPTQGSATVLGYTPWERKKEFKMQFAIVMGQKSQLWWDLPANESLNLNKYIYELDEKDFEYTVSELSELLDVKELLKVQVRRLSLGERMKMELIASLVHRPKLMLLDEPTIGLDVISQQKIRDFLKYYNQQNKTTILLTSHYMNDIEDLCRRSVIINQGRIVYDGDLTAMNGLFSMKKLIKLQLTSFVKNDELQAFGTIREYKDLAVTLEVDRKNIRELSGAILEKFPVKDFNIEDIPIEEGIAFLYRKGGDENDIP